LGCTRFSGDENGFARLHGHGLDAHSLRAEGSPTRPTPRRPNCKREHHVRGHPAQALAETHGGTLTTVHARKGDAYRKQTESIVRFAITICALLQIVRSAERAQNTKRKMKNRLVILPALLTVQLWPASNGQNRPSSFAEDPFTPHHTSVVVRVRTPYPGRCRSKLSRTGTPSRCLAFAYQLSPQTAELGTGDSGTAPESFWRPSLSFRI
jgi:hypothetical protein